MLCKDFEICYKILKFSMDLFHYTAKPDLNPIL